MRIEYHPTGNKNVSTRGIAPKHEFVEFLQMIIDDYNTQRVHYSDAGEPYWISYYELVVDNQGRRMVRFTSSGATWDDPQEVVEE